MGPQCSEEKRKRKEEIVAKREARNHEKRVKDALRCKGKHKRRPKWNNLDAWLWCSSCDYFGLCVYCAETSHSLLDQHELECSSDPVELGTPEPISDFSDE